REQQKQQAMRSYPHRNRCTTLSRGGSDLDENGGSRFGENQQSFESMVGRYRHTIVFQVGFGKDCDLLTFA
ncbi:hypothetical protein, partial [Burkholderia vietnamiensis]|uniref:hypothetical protein n=1 Tax=Burkholderia vietnamiensis TaxID=60552 RepID=UPI001CF5D39E